MDMAGEMTSVVGDQTFQGAQSDPYQKGKVIGFDRLFLKKGSIYQNDKKYFEKWYVLDLMGARHAHEPRAHKLTEGSRT